jgi:VanZ family protein
VTLPTLRPRHRPRLWLGLGIVQLLLALVVCLVPLPPHLPSPVDHFDKIEHLLGYLGLTAYAVMLFATRRALAFAALGLLLFGAMIELLQGLLPWRSADAADLVANASGVALGLLVALTPLSRFLQRVDSRMA